MGRSETKAVSNRQAGEWLLDGLAMQAADGIRQEEGCVLAKLTLLCASVMSMCSI